MRWVAASVASSWDVTATTPPMPTSRAVLAATRACLDLRTSGMAYQAKAVAAEAADSRISSWEGMWQCSPLMGSRR